MIATDQLLLFPLMVVVVVVVMVVVLVVVVVVEAVMVAVVVAMEVGVEVGVEEGVVMATVGGRTTATEQVLPHRKAVLGIHPPREITGGVGHPQVPPNPLLTILLFSFPCFYSLIFIR